MTTGLRTVAITLHSWRGAHRVFQDFAGVAMAAADGRTVEALASLLELKIPSQHTAGAGAGLASLSAIPPEAVIAAARNTDRQARSSPELLCRALRRRGATRGESA